MFAPRSNRKPDTAATMPGRSAQAISRRAVAWSGLLLLRMLSQFWRQRGIRSSPSTQRGTEVGAAAGGMTDRGALEEREPGAERSGRRERRSSRLPQIPA